MRKSTLEAALKERNAATNHARVVDQLGRDIVSGRFAAGELLPGDAVLAERFQVSRTVLRESLKTLDAKGLISPRVRIGTSVRLRRDWNHYDSDVLLWYMDAGVDMRLLSQFQEIRLALEPRAAALAALNATDTARSAISERINLFLSGSLQPQDRMAVLIELHAEVANASSNVFMQSAEGLFKAALIGHFKKNPDYADEVFDRASENYRELEAALSRRDGSAASVAMEAVIRASFQNV